ncbi:MAG: carboxypeptidase-like regulatory domain-containing protein [Arcticibacter sp.]
MKTYSLYLLLIIATLYGCKTLQKTIIDKEENDTNSVINIKKTQIFGDKAIVTGQILDIVTNEPKFYATVSLTDNQGKTIGCYSNENGEFEITNIQTGEYQLSVRSMELNELNTPLKIVAGNKYDLEIKIKKRVIKVEKPVIYLYPAHKQKINVKLHYVGTLTHTYPKYPEDGWTVTAEPNGTLWDQNNQEYYALFWEGTPKHPIAPTDGFVVAGTETARFLDEKLAYLGLNRREANEFIMYWLPRMENHPYNFIHFASKAYEEQAILDINPKPETIIRVMMLTQPLTTKTEYPLQDLSPLQKTRKGYTVVEWGGSVIDHIIEEL